MSAALLGRRSCLRASEPQILEARPAGNAGEVSRHRTVRKSSQAKRSLRTDGDRENPVGRRGKGKKRFRKL